jgi:peptidyl-prolyl cis-trans isomerase D
VLSSLRKSASQSVVLKGVFIAIVVVFIFWGIGVMAPDQMEVVARVNDEVISRSEFERAYEDIQRLYRDLPVNSVSPDLIRGQALDRLINMRLLVQEAQRLGLMVTDDELRRSIASIEAFRADGRFNKDAYLQVLRANRLKASDFEEAQRQQVLVNKLRQLVTAGVHVTENQLKEAFRFDNEKMSLRYLRIPSADFLSAVVVTDEDVQKHYSDRQEEFREPERVRIEYLFVDPEQLGREVQPTDDEIKEYYEQHLDEYRNPESPEQVKAIEEAREDIIAAIRKERGRSIAMERAQSMHERLRNGEPMEEVASSSHVQIQSPPVFPRQGPVVGLLDSSDLTDAAFETPAGELGEIVTLASGYVVFRVIERIDSFVPELEVVREQVEESVREQRAAEAAKERGSKLLERLKVEKDIDALARSEGLKVEETDSFVRAGGYIPNLGNLPQLKEAAFRLREDQPVAPEVYDLNGDAIIAALAERLPADEAGFEPEQDRLREETEGRLEVAVFEQFLNHLKTKSRIELGPGFTSG